MKNTRMLYYGLILVVGSLLLWGCPKKSDVTAAPEVQKEGSGSTSSKAGTENSGDKPAVGGEAQDKSGERAASASSAGLQPIYFDYDQSHLRHDTADIMINNAAWLKAHPMTKIRIEGNCDERGAREYNQALGQRRAISAKKFLTDSGISASRISLISFGKEKLLCTENTEVCWQKNRRDDFVIISE